MTDQPLTRQQDMPTETPSLSIRITMLLLASLTIMSGALIATSLPGIEARFANHENVVMLSRLVLTLPGLFVAIGAPFAGAIADRIGRKPLLLVSLLLYGTAGASGLFADSLSGLLIGRALLGLAVAGTMTTATALVGDYFSGDMRDRFMGYQVAFTGLGGLVFIAGGGVLTELHWRSPFAVYAIAFLLIPAVLKVLYEPEPVRHEPGHVPADDVTRRDILLVALFCLIAALNSTAFYLIPTQMPFYIEKLGIAPASGTGLAMGLLPLASAIASLNYGRLRRHFTIPALFAIGFGIMAVGMNLIALTQDYFGIAGSIGLTGLGLGMVISNMMAGAMAVAPPSIRGRVAGVLTASIFIGQFLSPLISQPWVDAFGYRAIYHDMGMLVGCFAVVGLLTAIRRRISVTA
ncbi:MFS family permease [Thalassospira sp. MBR-102]|nr:MFS transporter [Thalassospira xiamenensis]